MYVVMMFKIIAEKNKIMKKNSVLFYFCNLMLRMLYLTKNNVNDFKNRTYYYLIDWEEKS